MSAGSYLKDRVVSLLIFLLAVVAICLILWVYQVEAAIIFIVCLIAVVAAAVACAWDYLAKRRFYHELDAFLKNREAGQAYFLSELIDRPDFSEGQLLYDSLELANKDMNDQIAQYRLASEEYQEFVESWIHEIKTPLAASRLIIANRNDRGLRSLEHELDRTESYVEQALFYARSKAVEKDYSLKATKLETLVKNAVKRHARLLIEQGITPQFENLDINVYTDPKWLDFILGQIIANSARYAKPSEEGFIPELSFVAEHIEKDFDGGKVILSIRDNGIGVPAQDVSRVFEKGFTGENGRLYAKSTGIGLYLCRELCNRMKLAIDLTSQADEGTTVTIEFPLNKMYFLE